MSSMRRSMERNARRESGMPVVEKRKRGFVFEPQARPQDVRSEDGTFGKNIDLLERWRHEHARARG